jgi:hypothetical protein
VAVGANVTQGDLLTLSTLDFTESADNLTRINRQLCEAFADNCTQAEIDAFGIVSLRWDNVTNAGRAQVFCVNSSLIANATFFEFAGFPANFSGAVVVNILVCGHTLNIPHCCTCIMHSCGMLDIPPCTTGIGGRAVRQRRDLGG